MVWSVNKKALWRMYVLLVLAPFVWVNGASGKTITVDHSQPDSPPNRYDTIGEAITAATHGDVVKIMDGTYIENDLRFGGKAITVRSFGNDPNSCIVECPDGCADGNRGFVFDQDVAEQVLQGIKITNGNVCNYSGGGIYISNSSPEIRNCIISNCAAQGYGGGIYCGGSGTPKIINCTITDCNTTVDGYSGGGIFIDGCDAEVIRCTIRKNNTEQHGGGIYIHDSDDARIIDCNIIRNWTVGADHGGGIFVDNSDAEIRGCTIEGNFAYRQGGGICIWDGTAALEIDDCVIRYNTCNRNGGGIYSQGSTFTITNSEIANNTTYRNGGGMYITGGDATIENCTIQGNDCPTYAPAGQEGKGGGVCSDHSQFLIRNSSVANNQSYCDGGGLYFTGGRATLENCIIQGNRAKRHENGLPSTENRGGGIFANPSSMTIKGCVISDNSAHEEGGGICIQEVGVHIFNCEIVGNSAWSGGGIWSSSGSWWYLKYCTIVDNQATMGGGIDNNGGTLGQDLQNSIVWGNSGSNGYPQIRNASDSTMEIAYCNVQGCDQGDDHWDLELGTDGGGNIDADPMFFGDDDYRLHPDSPCIDSAHRVSPYVDIEGKSRPFVVDSGTSGYDMGAYEAHYRYVDDDPGTPVGAGYRNAPFDSIQDAIDASSDGDLVCVEAGTYNEAIDFGGKAVWLYATDGPEVTTIDGGGAYHVVQCISGETSETILEGFTIRGGNARSSGENASEQGGGMLVLGESTEPTVINCIFENNSAVHGGGFANRNGRPTLLHCVFRNNTAGDLGGAVFSYRGGGELRGCVFRGNTGARGGAISAIHGYSPAVTNCVFSENTGSAEGGAVWLEKYTSPVFTNCTFSGNEAPSGNTLYCPYESSGNKSTITITNSILSDDTDGIVSNGPATLTVTYSYVHGGFAGAGNISESDNPYDFPLFVGAGDYRHHPLSPCIDSGTDVGVNDDIEGNVRPFVVHSGTSGFDMGAYEAFDYYYVKSTAGAGGNGSIDSPYDDIQYAIDVSPNGSVICVRNGDYAGGLVVSGKRLTFVAETNQAVRIYCGVGTRGFHFEGSEASGSVVDGFKVLNGRADYGGGMLIEGASITVSNCRFLRNHADYSGGAIFLNDSASSITGCDFTSNSATDWGGAIYDSGGLCVITDCTETGTIDAGATELGEIRVNILPGEAVADGAQWQVAGQSTLHDSGETVALAPGKYTIEGTILDEWREAESVEVRVVAGLVQDVNMVYEALPEYEFGDVPPLNVRHGERLRFVLDCDSGGLSWWANPEPAGAIGFSALVDGRPLFSYEPSDDDVYPFYILLSAAGEPNSPQSVEVSPIPVLPDEASILQRDLSLPDFEDVDADMGSSGRTINYDIDGRSVALIGEDIVFARDEGVLFDSYGERNDINDLTIYGDTVTISAPLQLKQTDVTVYARQLIFEGDGSICTTPVCKESATNGASGENGLKAGDIALYVESFSSDPEDSVRFDLSGGKGQPGYANLNDGNGGAGGTLRTPLDVAPCVLVCGGEAGGPDGEPNEMGHIERIEGAGFLWVRPEVVKPALARAKEAYFIEDFDSVQELLTDYGKTLALYREDATWDALELDPRTELEQLYGEIENILHRIANNLDFYGNPAGWVPMLSFEVHYNLFQDEIDRAMDVLYLNHWLGGKMDDHEEVAKALASSRDALRKEITLLKGGYDKVINTLPGLEQDAIDVDERSQALQEDLKQKEEDLLAQAQNIVRKRHEVPWWKKGLRIGAKLCSVFPVGQPILGSVGEGLDILSNVDTQSPWDTIQQTVSLAGQFNKAAFKESAQSWKDFTEGSDPEAGTLEDAKQDSNLDKAMEYADKMAQVAGPIIGSIGDIRSIVQDREAPQSEVQAELEKLKSQCPLFQRELKLLEELLRDKRQLAIDIAVATQQISKLSNDIHHSLICLSKLNEDVAIANNKLDPGARLYLQEMDRRARERLKKYQYYMAKAYEYRVLAPYPGELSLASVFTKFEEIAADDSMTDSANRAILSPEGYDALRGFYQSELSTVVQAIIDFVSQNMGYDAYATYYLEDEQVEMLKRPESDEVDANVVWINLSNADIFGQSQRAMRVIDVNFVFDVNTIDPSKGQPEKCIVTLNHSGSSRIRLNDDVLQFRHSLPGQESSAQRFWRAAVDSSGAKTEHNPSESSQTLLEAVLENTSGGNMQMFIYPAFSGEFHIITDWLGPRGLFEIDGLTLNFKYDYIEGDGSDHEVRIKTVPEDLMPYFEVDTEDAFGRQDGYGSFMRVYKTDATISVTAPERYGDWKFSEWTTFSGDQNDPSNLIELNLGSGRQDRHRAAHYVYDPVGDPGDFDGDNEICLTDFSVFAGWLGQTCSSENDWCGQVDSNHDGLVDMTDFLEFTRYWLEEPM